MHLIWDNLQFESIHMGIPGWRSSLVPAFGPGRDPGDPGSNPTSGSRCMEPASPSACVSASLSVTIIKKIFKKEVKNRATLRFQNCTARYLPQGYRSCLVDSKRDTQPSVCSSIITKSQTVDTAQMSIDRWMGRDDVVNIHTATSLGHHKGWNEAIYNDVGEVERTYA